jgi:hypothetical protein
MLLLPRTNLSQNRTIHQKLDLSEEKLWVYTPVYNSPNLLPHLASTTTSTLDLSRLKTQMHFRFECTRIKRSDGPTPWLTGSSLFTTPPTKLSSPVSLSFWLFLPDVDCTCLASYWRSGKIAANQQCWYSTQLTIPHYASPSTPLLPIELNLLTTVLQNHLLKFLHSSFLQTHQTASFAVVPNRLFP